MIDQTVPDPIRLKHPDGDVILYTIEDLAKLLRKSTWAIYTMVRRGKIGYRKDGKRIVFTREDVIEYLDSVRVSVVRASGGHRVRKRVA